jgi:RNA polymerase sigma factor (TIGR02999 family)
MALLGARNQRPIIRGSKSSLPHSRFWLRNKLMMCAARASCPGSDLQRLFIQSNMVRQMPESNEDANQVTYLLSRWSGGDDESFNRLLPMVYSELREIARAYMRREQAGHTLQPTALVHEAFLRMVKHPTSVWQDRKHFYGVAARLMRQILVDHARSSGAGKRGRGLKEALMGSFEPSVSPRDTDFVVLEMCLKKLEKADPRKAQIVELRFFGGLSLEEVADAVDLSLSMVKRELTLAKLWMFREMKEQGAIEPEE